MEWNLDKGRPLCPQICEQICVAVALGEFKPNERLFSVREAALAAGVNPNTVQRSFETLEREGILYSQRGSGWFVSEHTDLAEITLEKLISKKTGEYFAAMSELGLSEEKIKKTVEEWGK